MKKREQLFLTFGIFFLLCLALFFLGKASFFSPVNQLFAAVTNPVDRTIFSIFHKEKPETELQKENKKLLSKLVDQKKLMLQNKALEDQFKTAYPLSQSLIAASVIGAPGLIPGISEPEYLIVDKGKKDGVSVGLAVVVENNLIGKITRVSEKTSRVDLVIKRIDGFTGKTLSTNALGVVQSDGGILSIENVVLSEKLDKGDFVVTKGDITEEKNGFPPDLVVGKIVSVDKKPSALFQTARLQSLIEVGHLTSVFIVSGVE